MQAEARAHSPPVLFGWRWAPGFSVLGDATYVRGQAAAVRGFPGPDSGVGAWKGRGVGSVGLGFFPPSPSTF